MVFPVRGNLERAQSCLEKGDDASLQYAALELRCALEKIAYKKLSVRLPGVPAEQLSKWQPGKVIKTLMSFVDAHIDQDSTISIKNSEGDWSSLGQNVGITPKEIGRHWQKLGSLLHAPMPANKGQIPSDYSVSKNDALYLEEVVLYIEGLIRTQFDAYFSASFEIQCVACGQTSVSTEPELTTQKHVRCKTAGCGCLYDVQVDGEKYSYTPIQYHLDCKNCDKQISIFAHKLHAVPYNERRTAECLCGAKYTIRWNLEYGAVNE